MTQVWNGHDSHFRNVAPIKENRNHLMIRFSKLTLKEQQIE